MSAAAPRAAPPEVAAVFDSYPVQVRRGLLSLRRLILDTAAETDGVGAIEEALRWGQPSYLTTETGSGSTIRLAPTNASQHDHDFGVFFNCNTTLIANFRAMFGDTLTYENNRALLFAVRDRIPEDELRVCVEMALTYHRSNR